VTALGALPGGCSVSLNPHVVAGRATETYGELVIGGFWIAELGPDEVYRVVYHNDIDYGNDFPVVSPGGQRVLAVNSRSPLFGIYSKVGSSWSGVRWASPFMFGDFSGNWWLSYDGSVAYRTINALYDLINRLKIFDYPGVTPSGVANAPGEILFLIEADLLSNTILVKSLKLPFDPINPWILKATVPITLTISGQPVTNAYTVGYTDSSAQFLWMRYGDPGVQLAVAIFSLPDGSFVSGKVFNTVDPNYSIRYVVSIPSGYMALLDPEPGLPFGNPVYVYNSVTDSLMAVNTEPIALLGGSRMAKDPVSGVVWLFVPGVADDPVRGPLAVTKVYRIPPPYTSIIPWQVGVPEDVTIPSGPNPTP